MRNANCMNLVKRGMVLALILSCLCVLVSMPVAYAEPVQIPEQSEEYKKGKALDDEKKYDEARPFFEAGTEKGDPWCMNALGLYYSESKGGLQKNDVRAFELISKAAEMNLPKANCNLGFAYLNGQYGVAVNKEKALEYLNIAAELNDDWANFNLGTIYLTGEGGITKDTEKGLGFLTKAADLNLNTALNYLGVIYIAGWYGVPKDEKKGLALIKKAADLNERFALYNLAGYYLNGAHGLSKDVKKGIELDTKAAELDHPAANYWLGCYHLEGTFGVKKDIQKGIEFLSKAADLGYVEAMSKLGFIYLYGQNDVVQDSSKALELLDKAISKGDSETALKLGSYYEVGTDAELHYQNAMTYYKKAKDLGNSKADNKIYNLEHLPDLFVGCAVLVRDYDENEVAADMKYQGKTVRVSGGIGEIGKDLMDNIYITFPGGKNTFRSVQCFFDKDRINEVAALKKGTAITVQGKVKGLMGNVLVEHCWIVQED